MTTPSSPPSSPAPAPPGPGSGGLPTTALLLAAVVGLTALLLRQCDATRTARDAADAAQAARSREAKEAQLEAEGVSVAHQAEVASLKRDLSAQRAQSAAFSAEVDRVEKTLANEHAELVALEHGSTGSFIVPSGSGGASADGAPAPATDPGTHPSAPGPGPGCRLAGGDRAEIDAYRATYELRGGVLALAATTTLWRLLPGGSREEVWSGPLRLESAYAPPPPPPRDLRWGLGAAGRCVAKGCAAGLAGAYQPWRHLELTGDATFYGAAEARSVGAAALVRW